MPSSPYFDPLGETEPHTTLYTLTVFVPERPPPDWIPIFFTRKAVRYPKDGSMFRIPPSDRNKDLDWFEHWDLDEVPTKTVVIKSAWFPAEMRCEHVHQNKVCREGCYFLEKGGKVARRFCGRDDCEGHVYCGRVQEDEQKRSCLGKKGARMVCVK